MKGNAAWSPVPFRLADEAHELLFDDHSGHALHFGEAAGEGGGGLAAIVFYAGATNLTLGKYVRYRTGSRVTKTSPSASAWAPM